MNITHFEAVIIITPAAAMGAVFAGVRFLYKKVGLPLRELIRVVRLVMGEPGETDRNGREIHARIPSMPEQFDQVNATLGQLREGIEGLYPRVDILEKHFQPDGGGSIRDKVDRIDKALGGPHAG